MLLHSMIYCLLAVLATAKNTCHRDACYSDIMHLKHPTEYCRDNYGVTKTGRTKTVTEYRKNKHTQTTTVTTTTIVTPTVIPALTAREIKCEDCSPKAAKSVCSCIGALPYTRSIKGKTVTKYVTTGANPTTTKTTTATATANPVSMVRSTFSSVVSGIIGTLSIPSATGTTSSSSSSASSSISIPVISIPLTSFSAAASTTSSAVAAPTTFAF